MSGTFESRVNNNNSTSAASSISSNKSTSFTLSNAASLFYIDATAGAVTATIPAASTVPSFSCYLKKTDSSFNMVTLSGGIATTIATQNESILLQSDGSSWTLVSRYVPSNWTAYTPTTTNGPSSTTLAKTFWRREGDSVVSKGEIVFNNADGTGSNFYVNILPSGLITEDTGKNGTATRTPIGSARFFQALSGVYASVPSDGGTGRVCFVNPVTQGVLLGNDLAASDYIAWYTSLPVTNWNG